MAVPEGERFSRKIHVERVTDADSDDLHDALNLYRERIPPSEQFEVPDIVRWIREDLEQIEKGIIGPRDFFLVAKLNDQVCGFILFHYYPKSRLAFIAYLVAAAEHSSPNYSREGVSKRLLAQVRTFVDGPLKDCEGILLEVDHPLAASTEQEMLERVARIRLFCMLAHAQGFSLRAFDMDYLQPPLSLENPDVSVPMLLMYVNPRARAAVSHLKSSSVRKILKFIYTELYPHKYSDNETENRRYKACLRKFAAARLKTLPQRISMLDFKQIKARTTEEFRRPPLGLKTIPTQGASTSVAPEQTSASDKLVVDLQRREAVVDRAQALREGAHGSESNLWEKLWEFAESNFFWGGGAGLAIAAYGLLLGGAPRWFAFSLLVVSWLVFCVSVYRHKFFEKWSPFAQVAGNAVVYGVISTSFVILWILLVPKPERPKPGDLAVAAVTPQPNPTIPVSGAMPSPSASATAPLKVAPTPSSLPSNIRMGMLQCSASEYDEGYKLMTGATCIAKHQTSGQEFSGGTDFQGMAQIHLPYGFYIVTVKADGYITQVGGVKVDREVVDYGVLLQKARK